MAFRHTQGLFLPFGVGSLNLSLAVCRRSFYLLVHSLARLLSISQSFLC